MKDLMEEKGTVIGVFVVGVIAATLIPNMWMLLLAAVVIMAIINRYHPDLKK